MTKHQTVTIDQDTGEVFEGTAVAVAPPTHAPAHIPSASSPLEALIERAVFEGANMDAVERLLGLKERVDQANAKKAFDGAIAASKAGIAPIVKNRVVDFTGQKGRTHYKFEDLAAIAAAVDPVLSQHGLSYRWRTGQTGQTVRVTCIVSHRDGYFEETSLEAPADNSGNKNGIQGIGSTITFLQRYTLKAALGLAVSADDDGKAAAPQGGNSGPAAPTELTASQVKTLRTLIADTGTDEKRFLATAKAEAIEDVRPADFPRLEGLLKRKLADKQAAAQATQAAAPAEEKPAA